MKLSAQEEFGVRCLITIAKNGSMTIPALAAKEGISQSHVAKILALLKRSGYVTSTRGQIGGYTLSRSASEMLLKDVLSELGGKIYREDFCDRFTGLEKVCVHDADCSILPLWMSIQKAIDVALNGLTLQDLLEPSAGINVKLFNESNARPSAC